MATGTATSRCCKRVRIGWWNLKTSSMKEHDAVALRNIGTEKESVTRRHVTLGHYASSSSSPSPPASIPLPSCSRANIQHTFPCHPLRPER